MTPPRLATQLQSLPPILHIAYPKPILSYSKGARGLFVPQRVIGIFTDTTISPSSWLRQCPDRCTIRAGRNLPDKEFRYLRTVIVTAAVYWGFNSMLRRSLHLLLTFQHRAGVKPYTSSFDLAKLCVFDKQSPGLFHCGPPGGGRRFSRSYASILPSSLAMNLSSSLEFSSQPPVSVWGTGCLARFSWKSILRIITLAEASAYYRGVTAPFNALFRQCAPNFRLRRF